MLRSLRPASGPLLVLALLAHASSGCDGSLVVTGERGAEPAGSGGRGGFGAGGGSSQAGSGPTGSAGQPPAPGPTREPTVVTPAGKEPVVTTACQLAFPGRRPHSLAYQGSLFRLWSILATSPEDRAGTLGYGATAIAAQSYAVPTLEERIYYSPPAPLGGVRQHDTREAVNVPDDVVIADGVVSDALAACKGHVLRKRTGDHGGVVFERIDEATKAVERIGPLGLAPDREPGRVEVEDCLDVDRAQFVWTIETGGPDAGLYTTPLQGGPVKLVAAGSNHDFTLLRGSVLRVVPGTLPDGRRVQTLESIPVAGGTPKALFTIEAFAMTPPVDVDERLYFAATFAANAPAQLLRAPAGGGTPQIVSPDICPADPWLPSLTGSAIRVDYVCPGSGQRCSVQPRD